MFLNPQPPIDFGITSIFQKARTLFFPTSLDQRNRKKICLIFPKFPFRTNQYSRMNLSNPLNKSNLPSLYRNLLHYKICFILLLSYLLLTNCYSALFFLYREESTIALVSYSCKRRLILAASTIPLGPMTYPPLHILGYNGVFEPRFFCLHDTLFHNNHQLSCTSGTKLLHYYYTF